MTNTNSHITSDIMENIIKNTHIFNPIILALYSHIIKASAKSSIAIIWIDIWDS